MTKPRRIVYIANDDHGCDNRKLEHTGSLTDILSETISYSQRSLVEIGDRWVELVRVPLDGDNIGWTHSRESSWIVDSIEVYKPSSPSAKYSEIVYCYCSYSPIVNAELVKIIDGDRAKELVAV